MGDSSSNLASILHDQNIRHRSIRESFLSGSQVLLSNFSCRDFRKNLTAAEMPAVPPPLQITCQGRLAPRREGGGLWFDGRERDMSHRMATLVLLQLALLLLRGGRIDELVRPSERTNHVTNRFSTDICLLRGRRDSMSDGLEPFGK